MYFSDSFSQSRQRGRDGASPASPSGVSLRLISRSDARRGQRAELRCLRPACDSGRASAATVSAASFATAASESSVWLRSSVRTARRFRDVRDADRADLCVAETDLLELRQLPEHVDLAVRDRRVESSDTRDRVPGTQLDAIRRSIAATPRSPASLPGNRGDVGAARLRLDSTIRRRARRRLESPPAAL